MQFDGCNGRELMHCIKLDTHNVFNSNISDYNIKFLAPTFPHIPNGTQVQLPQLLHHEGQHPGDVERLRPMLPEHCDLWRLAASYLGEKKLSIQHYLC